MCVNLKVSPNIGIGLGIAKVLASCGADVMVNGFGSPDQIQEAQASVTSMGGGGKVAYHGADLSQPAQIKDMMLKAKEEFGGVDILVNNAGM